MAIFIALMLEVGAPSSAKGATGIDQDLRKPLTKCWEDKDSGRRLIEAASDNGSLLTSNSPAPTIEKWNAVDKASDWTLPLPGEIVKAAALDDGRILLFINGTAGIVQSITSETGLVVWQRILPSRFLKDAFFIDSTVSGSAEGGVEGEILFIGEDREVRKLDLSSGVLSELGIKVDANVSRILRFGDSLLFPQDGRWKILSLDKEERVEFGRYESEVSAVTTVSALRFAFGDSKGVVSLYRIGRDSPAWHVKTGAAISELVRVGDSLVVSSRDNYIYSFNIIFGTLEWKKRFEGRILPLSIHSHFAAVSAVDSRTVEIIDLKNGKKINGISEDSSEARITDYRLSGRFLSVQTNFGIRVYSANCSSVNEKADR